jgi:hypothetical protein
MSAILDSLLTPQQRAEAEAADAAERARAAAHYGGLAEQALIAAAAAWDDLPGQIRRMGSRVHPSLEQLRAVIASLSAVAVAMDDGSVIGIDDVACSLDQAHDGIAKCTTEWAGKA